MKNPPDISIVVPAYNEANRLPRALERISDWVKRKHAEAGLEIEIVIVDDGSTDETAQIVARWQRELPDLRLIAHGLNRGKGYSVRHGVLESRGAIVFFTDADLAAPIEEALVA